MKEQTNRHRGEAKEYKIGDMVLLSTRDLKWQMVGRRMDVMNCLDPIEDLYNMYSGKEEKVPRIVELEDMNLDFGLENGPVDPFLELLYHFSIV